MWKKTTHLQRSAARSWAHTHSFLSCDVDIAVIWPYKPNLCPIYSSCWLTYPLTAPFLFGCYGSIILWMSSLCIRSCPRLFSQWPQAAKSVPTATGKIPTVHFYDSQKTNVAEKFPGQITSSGIYSLNLYWAAWAVVVKSRSGFFFRNVLSCYLPNLMCCKYTLFHFLIFFLWVLSRQVFFWLPMHAWMFVQALSKVLSICYLLKKREVKTLKKKQY